MDRIFKFKFPNTAILNSTGNNQYDQKIIYGNNNHLVHPMYTDSNLKAINLISTKATVSEVFNVALQNSKMIEAGIKPFQKKISEKIEYNQPLGMFVGEIIPQVTDTFWAVYRREVVTGKITHDQYLSKFKNSIIEDAMEYYLHIVSSTGKNGFIKPNIWTFHWNFLREKPIPT
jgi:dTDP-D-glucose 4,6-dehydratase